MSDDPKNFLQRWSRRKQEASAPPDAVPKEKISAHDVERDEAAIPAAPEFDLASLPPLESIGAESDIRAFLQQGIPQAISRAALRRAWAADPAIRDFVGLSENSWDFNVPASIPGFGTLEPEDVRRLATQLFGEPDIPVASAGATPDRHPLVQTASIPKESETPILHEMRQPSGDTSKGAKDDEVQPPQKQDGGKVETGAAKQTKVDGATQYKEENLEYDEASPRQRHGSALPK
jgi:hypothetical protein